jgi:demethylmenaquinone methyltransferase/2-methoxy-6-polyprenyl-1,4-benzoquinol methylase
VSTTSSATPNAFARQLFEGLPDRYDLLVDMLTFGQNARWRRHMVERVLASRPGRVCDVATGTAGVALQVADRSDAEVVGVDLSLPMLRRGAANVAAHGGVDGRVRLVAGQAERLPFPDASFDALTFTYLLRYVADPGATLRELARVVRPGGVVSSLDFLTPSQPAALWAWRLYTRAVLPVAGASVGGRAWFRAGRFLGPNIEQHYQRWPVDRLAAGWRDAGFEDVGVREMSLGGGLVMWGRRTA